jgi:hypothetical protein
MAEEIKIVGDPARQFAKLAADLRKAGAQDLRKALYSGIQVAARPLIDAAKASAASSLPKGGGRGARHVTRSGKKGKLKTSGRAGYGNGQGSRKVQSLAERVVSAKYQVKAKAGANPMVSVMATSAGGAKVDLNALDSGTFRHPLFGNKKHWYPQSVPPGWWSNPMTAGVPAVQAKITESINSVTEALNSGL